MLRSVKWRQCVLCHSGELLIKSLASLINDLLLELERALAIRAVKPIQTIILNFVKDKNYFLKFCMINSNLNQIIPSNRITKITQLSGLGKNRMWV